MYYGDAMSWLLANVIFNRFSHPRSFDLEKVPSATENFLEDLAEENLS